MTRVGVLVAVLCTSCVQSGEVTCDDGRLCPPGYTCDDANHRCLSEGQLAACDGKPDGAECTFGGAPGECTKGVCQPLVCGDGVRSFSEACDGTDFGGADCTTAGFYNPDGLACTSFCTFEVSACTGSCGDNMINGDELCDGTAPAGTCFDLGFDAGSLACATSCGYSFASCGRFGWIPEPMGLPFVDGFAASSASDLWAVGQDLVGTAVIAHYDGGVWMRESLSANDKLVAIWAIAKNDAWIARSAAGVGQPSRPLHYDGTQWTTVAAAPLADYTDVWAASANAVFLSSLDSGVKWWNGSTWQALGTLTDPIVKIRGTSDSDIWAVKADGSLAHWSGAAWLPVSLDVTVSSIDVLSATSVWVIGSSTTSTGAAIAHWNGSTWTSYVDSSVSNSGYVAVGALADNDVWVAGPLGEVRHFDGNVWINTDQKVTTDGTANLIAIRRYGDVTIGMASNGVAHRYYGQMIARLTTGDPNPAQSVWSAAGNATYVGDLRGNVYRYNGSTWTKYIVDAAQAGLPAIWGSGPNDVWAGSNSGRVYHWNGSAWSLATTVSGGVAAIWGTGPNNVWFLGVSINHYDGSTFTPLNVAGTGFFSASGSGPSDIWSITSTSAAMTNVWRYDGNTWSATAMPHDMTAIVAVAANDVFVAADTNHVLHYDGSTWTDTVVPVSTRLDHIVATAHDDVIATSTTEVVHFDGTKWTPVRVGNDPTSALRAVFAAPGAIDFLVTSTTQQTVRRLIRTRFWNCRATETGCSDGTDDDCDGAVDTLDPDC